MGSVYARLFRLIMLFAAVSLPPKESLALGNPKPNLLIITVDDMSADSLGAFGCKLPGTSPHIDRLAERGVRFQHAHVVVGNCMPSRNVMWSGLYPHNNGVEGFTEVPTAKYPHLVDLMKNAGYFTAIRGKIAHSTPYTPYGWDVELDKMPDGSKAHPKNIKSYGVSTTEGIGRAKAAGKPFCLMINISDPHKPFYAEAKNGDTIHDPNVPSRIFKPEEVPIPAFLFDDPVVRKELAHYYSSVRRADDCAGEVLQALEDSGEAANTLILFLSDHGMPLPFSKTQLYHDSSRTPLFFVWPGILPSGKIDTTHMVSTVDLLPTLLELLNVTHPGKMDGRSFAKPLKDGVGVHRDWIVKEYHENSSGARNPMRAIQTLEHLYIFNPWSDGQRIMTTATMGTPTYRRMVQLALSDPAMATRLAFFQHRAVEELYDVIPDPGCRRNRVAQPEAGPTLAHLRSQMEAWMVQFHDPAMEAFRRRDNCAALSAFMDDETRAAPKRGTKKKRTESGEKAAPKKSPPLLTLTPPDDILAGKPAPLVVQHNLPESMGEQILTVSLKEGARGERLDRKAVRVKGVGTVTVPLNVPVGVDGNVSFAVFIGEDFKESPHHVNSKPVAVQED